VSVMVETIKDQYEILCSYENLERSFKGARKGKTNKNYVIEFEQRLKENLLQLRTELLMQTYDPQPLVTFILRDPKTRKISKSAFRDRVVHHAICNIIEPHFDKRFIHDSYANRLGKGTLNAIKRFDKFKRKVSKNNTKECYVLKADIKSYFDTVNHKILLQILGKRIKDERRLWLIRKIFDNHHCQDKNKGMPLGNLTSQFFANVYLNEFDQFIKHKLRTKYYIRYVDDFVILHPSKRLLFDYKNKIDQYLRKKLDLRLHPDKSKVLKLEKGIEFLGFRIFYHHKLLARKNLQRFKRNMEITKSEYRNGKIERETIIEKFEGWLSYATNANTYKLRRTLTRKFNYSFPSQCSFKITIPKKHENLNNNIEASNLQFTYDKTLFLFKKGYSVEEIAKQRSLKKSTIWQHITFLIEYHQISLNAILQNDKIKKILRNIKSPNDELREIKERVNDDSISYNEINCVLANLKGKHKRKSITYFIQWYQRTNCFRKCYFNNNQRQECRVKFQQFIAKDVDLIFTKKEFLDFFNNHVNICTLPDNEKKRFVSWKEYKQSLRKKKQELNT